MKKTVFILCLLVVSLILFGRQSFNNDSCHCVFNKKTGTYFYIAADTPAEYEYGDDSLYSYIYSNVKFIDLSKSDIDFSYGEKLIALAYIDEKGKFVDLELVKKSWITKCGIYDNQIVKLIKDIPQWTPAKCNEKNVPFRKSLFISFSLRNINLYIKKNQTPRIHY